MGMPPSMQASRDSVGAYLPPTLRPGPELLGEIAAEHGTWPTFHALDGLSVPALENTAEWHLHRRNPCAFLKPAAAEYLDTEHPLAGERLQQKPHAFAELRDLTAAVWLDVGESAIDDLRVRIRPDLASMHDRREGNKAVNRYARNGRGLWTKLGAWPWWPIASSWADGGKNPPPSNWEKLPIEWWRLPRVVKCWAAWTAASQAPLRN